MKAPLPTNEAERLCVLLEYGVLDTPPELAFDDLTHLAAQICGTPTALVTLIDEQRQWFKSLRGFTTTETKRDLAFCAHSILQRDVLIVPDATKDPRFSDNALVTGAPHIRFYAGAPLVTSTGFALGSLAVIDYVPRELRTDQVRALQALSRQAVAQLELRRQLMRQQERAHTALLVNERRYRRLLESNIIGVMIANTDGRIIEANDMLLQTVGYTRQEMQTSRVRWDTLTPPEWRGLDARIIEQLQITGACAPCEKEYLHKDGRRVPVLVSVALLEDTAGDCLCLVADITERKRAEVVLQESEHRLRSILDTMFVFVGLIALDGRIVEVNQAPLLAAGLDRKDVLGRTVGESYWFAHSPATQEQVRRALARAAQGELVREDYSIRIAEGRHIVIDTTFAPLRDAAGRTIQIVGSAVDITERKKTEESLGASEARYHALFEYAPDGIVIADPESYYLDANASACRMFGYTRKEFIGLHASDIVVATETLHIAPALSLIHAKSDYHRVWQFRRKDGSTFAAEVIATKMPDGNLLGMIRDITERRHADQRIRDQLAELLRWQDVMLGRENRVQALKAEVNALLTKLKQPPRYSDSSSP